MPHATQHEAEDAVGLIGLGAYAPARVMTNADWTAWIDTSAEWITSRTGIERRRFAAADETTVDLAEQAARRALADAGLSPTQLDEIIVTTDTPEVYFPDTAAFLQHRLGAREIPSYDLAGSGCSGFLQGLDIARSRVMTGARRVLVVGVELLSRLIDWRDRSTCVLFGDGAGAVVVAREPGASRIVASVAGTDGSKTELLILEAGGSRRPITEDVARRGLHRHIAMDGRGVFREAVTRMSAAARQVLARAGLSARELGLVVPHQANVRIIDAVARSLALSPSQVFTNVKDFGNTGSASVPLALCQARAAGRVEPGAYVLLVSFGAGFHWAATLLRASDTLARRRAPVA